MVDVIIPREFTTNRTTFAGAFREFRCDARVELHAISEANFEEISEVFARNSNLLRRDTVHLEGGADPIGCSLHELEFLDVNADVARGGQVRPANSKRASSRKEADPL